MRLLISIFLLSLLVGCTTPTTIKAPKIDSYLLTKCELPSNSIRFTSFEEVLAEKGKDNLLFKECAQKHSGLVDSINKYTEEFSSATK